MSFSLGNQVLDGERLTLTLWFTRNNEHDEDAKLISLLSQRPLNCEVETLKFCFPSPPPDNMYWFSHDQFGFDIRYARLNILGFQLFSSWNGADSSSDPLELLSKPLQLGRDDEIFHKEFANGLHALQVAISSFEINQFSFQVLLYMIIVYHLLYV